MYSPVARSVVLRRRNRTIIDLLDNVFIHNAAKSKLYPQMAEPCKVRSNNAQVDKAIETKYLAQGHKHVDTSGAGTHGLAPWSPALFHYM